MNVSLQIFELHSQNNIRGLCKRVTELDLYSTFELYWNVKQSYVINFLFVCF